MAPVRLALLALHLDPTGRAEAGGAGLSGPLGWGSGAWLRAQGAGVWDAEETGDGHTTEPSYETCRCFRGLGCQESSP